LGGWKEHRRDTNTMPQAEWESTLFVGWHRQECAVLCVWVAA
jgi:hypothetical protein